MDTLYLKKWNLKDLAGKGIFVSANVPGDINADLYAAGVIENPYYAMNHKKYSWIGRTDFAYETTFAVSDEFLTNDEIYLNFDGVDLFSEVYLNGKLLGKTENMFMAYRYEVKELLNSGDNTIVVKMISTLNEMDKIDCGDYFGTFNIPRILIRKAQCHFGWDWAPNMGGYGIWKDVYLSGENKYRIDDLYYRTSNDGWVTLFVELNYNVRPMRDYDGAVIEGTSAEIRGDKLVFSVATEPFGTEYKTVEVEVMGAKNFANLKVDTPELWWPNGYGEQPLYPYKAELFRDGVKVSEKSGRLAFRTVELIEEVKDEKTLGFEFAINGERIFLKGSNWVPMEIFTGTISDRKYETLLSYAKDANYNMMRIWGGGVYENDRFYELCDELGITVMQDFMLACSDIPEERQEWKELMEKECIYQLKRLRNYPCIIYWNGGNEKVGGFCLQKGHGDYFVDNHLRGLVANYDPTRPYGRQCPLSHTDTDNDMSSGDVHYAMVGSCLTEAVETYRHRIAENTVNFITEFAAMGPNSIETNRKIYPEKDIWPQGELWVDRLMENPYDGLEWNFLQMQHIYINKFYGESKDLADFTFKGMLMQAEMLKAELEYARFRKGRTMGCANWMYNDIWPSGTWSVIDYYNEPKQVYYQQRKTYEPVLISFSQNEKEETCLFVANDTPKELNLNMRFGLKTLSGEVRWEKKVIMSVGENGYYSEPVAVGRTATDEYFYVEAYDSDGRRYHNLYSQLLWKDCKFESDYVVKKTLLNEYEMEVEITANKFAKSVFLSFPDNFKYQYSDNYIDVEGGTSEKVLICSGEPIEMKKMIVRDMALQS